MAEQLCESHIQERQSECDTLGSNALRADLALAVLNNIFLQVDPDMTISPDHDVGAYSAVERHFAARVSWLYSRRGSCLARHSE